MVLTAIGCLSLALVNGGCATLGDAGDGIIMIGENGQNKPVTPEEIDFISGLDQPYYIQVGDVVNVDFKLRTMRSDEVPWDYRIEVGDSMEVRLGPDLTSPNTYKLDVGDVIGISFLDNWELNVTRTVRTDGYVTAPEVGDVLAAGRTSEELRDALKDKYEASGIIQGEPKVTVNVDFVNLDRYESMSRDVIVRPDGAIRLPAIETDLHIGGLTIQEATDLIRDEAARVMQNQPTVGLIIFPAVDTTMLGDMSGALQVKPDGKISIKRIGEIQAAGYSVEELEHDLTIACEGLIHNPVEPSVEVLKATGGRIYVGGEVNNPGVYPLEGAPTALQSVMMANGFNNDSRLNDVIVMRRNPNGKPFVFKTNLRVALTRGHTDNDIMLRPFDTVFVPKKIISRLNLFVEQYIEEMVPFDNQLGVNAVYYTNTQQTETKSRNFNFNAGTTGVLDVLNP